MAWHGKVRPGLLLLLISFVVISGTTAKELYRYETAYACEGKTLKIDCKDGELIKLIRANYGRFSIIICNDHGNTDWSVNCMSPKSLRVLHSRCTMNQNCSIPASTSMFGDPCPGTHKYLEAHYQCLPATTTTTTSRPSPPWLITQPPMWSTLKPTMRPPPLPPKVTSSPSFKTASTTSSTSMSTWSTSLPSSSVSVVPQSHPEHGEDKNSFLDNANMPGLNPLPEEITTLPYTTYFPKRISPDSTMSNAYAPSPGMPFWHHDFDLSEYCSPINVRTIFWNWTRVGDNLNPACPGGSTGFARWRCVKGNPTATWSPSTPDLSACRSVWLTSLEQRIKRIDRLVLISNELAKVTNSQNLYGGDILLTTNMIKLISDKMSKVIQASPDPRQRETLVTEMLNDVIKTSSNLLDFSQYTTWTDLKYDERMRVATSLLMGLEDNAFLLAETVMRKKTVDQIVKNIMLSVRVLETKSITTETFPSGSQLGKSNDSIEIPQNALLENSDGGLVRLVFIAFNGLEEILKWHPDSSEASANGNITRILNSKIICASLGKGRHIQLKFPVRLTFKHLQTENVTNPSCVFWDYLMNSWSKEGCSIDSTNTTHTICQCNHLTNFAILMDVHGIHLSSSHETALKIITYIGCIISIICLLLAIITFQVFRGLKSDRTTIHSNLCGCLLIAELIFLIGIEQTQNELTCSIIAAFMEYFFLCAFVWMFFEGFQLYVMLVEVFEVEKSRVRWYYIFAYGVPLVIILISWLVNKQGYGTDKFCWLKTDSSFIYSFVAPVIFVLLLNLIFLTLAIIVMCKHSNASMSIKNKEHSRLASTRIWLRGAIVLLFVLGLTWTFGFLYLSKESVAVAYIFTILNSLQGFFIFYFQCAQNEKVKKEYKKFFRRYSWLPKCLHCSKQTTSSSGGSGSSGKERRTSLYAGSNGNPSGSHSHSTDNSVLSPHGTSNISFKSYSRDSGHGGSEQEDSPRSQTVIADMRLNNAKDVHRQAYLTTECNPTMANNIQQSIINEYTHRHDSIPHPKHLALPQSLQPHGTRRKNGNLKPKWNNHTYTEIYDARGQRCMAPEEDPVYEEIERNEIQVSDMSDEDGKRQSDMSRQSSRSYGDHRPLIPYSPGTDRNILDATSKMCFKDHNRYASEMETYRMRPPNVFRGDPARSLAAVLDGETVVCHLEPPEMYHSRESYRTHALPPYSES